MLLTGLGTAAVAQGFVEEFDAESSGSVRSPLQINGSVACTQCWLADVRQAHPQEQGLYQFSSTRGPLVFKVASVTNPSRFEAVAWSRHLWVRASDGVLQQLAAKDNVFKPIGLTAMLSPGPDAGRHGGLHEQGGARASKSEPRYEERGSPRGETFPRQP